MDKNELIKHINIQFTNSDKLKNIIKKYNNIMLFGNGGSHAIAEHISQDYINKLNKRCFTMSNTSQLTAYSNDYGYKNAYLKFLKTYIDENTLVILLSSSGNSKNIIKCATYCSDNNIPFITFSGFNKNNLLNSFNNALLNIYVNSSDYGIVECLHELLLHSII